MIREFLPWPHLLTYLDAILRVYNRYGRRDNIHKARIKILVKERGAEKFREEVDAEWAQLKDGPATVTEAEIAAHRGALHAAATTRRCDGREISAVSGHEDAVRRLAEAQRASAQAAGLRRGHAVAEEDRRAAGRRDLRPDGARSPISPTTTPSASCASRTSRTWCSPTCARPSCTALWLELRALGLATPNIGLLTNIISCPGGDFCSLANAKSIPVAEAIQRRFDDLDYLHDIGELDLNISGCINACGHHHVGHIGILGVDKNGEEWYQVEIGGNQGGAQPRPARARQDHRPVVRARRRARRRRAADRDLSRAARQRERALRRRGAPHRHRTFQETASMPTLIKNRQIVDEPSPPDLVVLEPTDDPALRRPSASARSRVIAVNFPKFGDGRGYSIARLLRERYGYQGELRAVGEVARDHLQLHGAVRLRLLPAARGRGRAGRARRVRRLQRGLPGHASRSRCRCSAGASAR